MRSFFPLAMMLFALPAMSQAFHGSKLVAVHPKGVIHGKVSTAHGDPIPNAVVQLKPIREDSRTHQTKTNAKGEFLKAGLDASKYTLTVTATGFVSSEPKIIKLLAAEGATYNVTLVQALDPVATKAKP